MSTDRSKGASLQAEAPSVELRQPFGTDPEESQPVSEQYINNARPSTSSTLSTGAFTLCCGSDAYGRPVSGAVENRAAVFTSKPQAVEVYQAGAWWAGELLGWRHAADDSCQVWVRVVLGGVEETAWTDLETLRLPERHLAMAPEPASVESAAREQSVARHPSSRREHRADSDASATASMPMVRDLSIVSDAAVAPSGGRRRAPEVPGAVSAGGRRRAPEEPAVASAGGRRRAPESPAPLAGGRRRAPEEPAVASAGGRRRAPEDPVPAPAPVPAAAKPAARLGRHGLPAPAAASTDAGRHRTADTGLFQATADTTATLSVAPSSPGPTTSARGRAIPAARPVPSEETRRSSVGSWSAPSGLESELLTRPMRLSDHVPHSRRPRLDGSLRGV
jgi:hypothetical protein